jgi:hypothetical protein
MSHMAKKEDTVEPTVTINRKKLVTAGWIAGGVLALGATFAAGSAIGNVMDGPRGGDFAAGQSNGSGEFGPQGGHGADHAPVVVESGGGHGDQAGQHKGGQGGDQANRGHKGGHGGMMAPVAPTAPNDGTTTPAPTTTP